LNHHELEAAHEANGKPEVSVELREDFFEHILFNLAHLPAVEVVEHLKEDKSS